MDGHRDRDDLHAKARDRLEKTVRDAVRGVEQAPEDETSLRHASWQTELFRWATIASGERRATIAARVRESGRLSFARLGKMMGVSRARALEIVKNAKLPAEPEAPMIEPDTPLRPAIAAAVVTSKQGVLVERRIDGRPLWTFPAGEIEPGESPADCVIRETKEECGLQIKVSHVIGERIHPATRRQMYYLACRPYQGTDVHNGDEAELAEVKWTGLAEAEELLTGMFPPVLEHLRRTLG